MTVASLPWYALAETRSARDRFWKVLAGHLAGLGVAGVPDRLFHDPPIPELLTRPDLVLGQCCGYDLAYGFGDSLVPVATPCFAAAGCDGPSYRSVVLVRAEAEIVDLADLRGRTCAINSFNSQSGANALRALVAPLAKAGRFFARVHVTGGHLASLDHVKAGAADVMAMDCVVHALLTRHRPAALAGTRIVAQAQPAPAPPFVTARATAATLLEPLREAFRRTMVDDASRDARDAMLLAGVEILPLSTYDAIVALEAEALRHGYRELHATSAIVDWPADP